MVVKWGKIDFCSVLVGQTDAADLWLAVSLTKFGFRIDAMEISVGAYTCCVQRREAEVSPPATNSASGRVYQVRRRSYTQEVTVGGSFRFSVFF